MLLFKQALKQLLRSGAKTWLNVAVLSLTMFTMIFLDGLYDGLMYQMKDIIVKSWVAEGQLWHKNYDPFDPTNLNKSTAPIPTLEGTAPILLIQGSIYPNRRHLPALIKGIPPEQKTIDLPTQFLKGHKLPGGVFPVLIGSRMAKKMSLNQGDSFMIRWRSKAGAFQASEGTIIHIFETADPAIDLNQIWVPLNSLQDRNDSPGEATLIISSHHLEQVSGPWIFKSKQELLLEIDNLIDVKKKSGSFLILVLLFMIFLSVLDTQALSIFHRKKELGILMALGLSPRRVMKLLIIEGIIYGFLASCVLLIIGVPIFIVVATQGIPVPYDGASFGVAMADRMYPVFSLKSLFTCIISVGTLLIIASYWPARKTRGDWVP